MNKIKSASECISPLSAIFVAICIFPTLYVVLNATPFGFFIMFVVDTFAFFLQNKAEGTIYQKMYPYSAVFFQGEKYDATVEKWSQQEKESFFESAMRFPQQRAIYVSLWSLIKIIPATLVIVFYWKHENTNLEQFFLTMGVSLFNICYFYGATFLEAHSFCSEVVARLHDKFDFSEVFKNVTLTSSQKDFELQEALSFVSIFFFVFVLQALVLRNGGYQLSGRVILELGLVSTGGVLLFLRLWYLNKRFFVGGLELLFKKMDNIQIKSAWKDLSLHTSPILAEFEKTFNFLSHRIRQSERELAALVVQEADRSRFQVLGEVSALIAHDMAGPLHTIQYCVEEIINKQSPPLNARLTDLLSKNIEKAVSLIQSIRSRFKNTSGDKSTTSFTEVHQNIVRFLETQFSKGDFSKVNFSIDPAIEKLDFKINQVDLTHILENLYRNSLTNMLSNQVSEPKIEITVSEAKSQLVSLIIKDNGTGLSRQRFLELTTFRYAQPQEIAIHQGLGMRLTCRLVEMSGGALEVLDQDQKGTCFKLVLKLNS